MPNLLRACEEYPDNGRTGQPKALRLRTLLLVLRYTGLRIQDAVMLDESKVDAMGRIFLRRQQKTGGPVFFRYQHS